MLDPDKFFQINRQFIISWKAVKDIVSYSNSRLKVALDHFSEYDVIVSRERVNEFKAWLDR